MFAITSNYRKNRLMSTSWILDAGYWMLDAGYWMLDTG
jgi:hypothetical protein